MRFTCKNGETVEIVPYVKTICKGFLHRDNDDIIQEVCLIVFKQIDSFKGETASSLKSWLWKICRNSVASYNRRMFRSKFCPLIDKPSKSLEPINYLIKKEENENLYDAISLLPENYSVVLNMSALEELPDKEVAKKLEITIPCVKSRLHRSKLMLRKILVER